MAGWLGNRELAGRHDGLGPMSSRHCHRQSTFRYFVKMTAEFVIDSVMSC